MSLIVSAVFTGMVDFSTMILGPFACSAIVRATDSMNRRSAAPAHSVSFSRGVDRDENDVGRFDRAVDIGGKNQILTASLPDDLIETRLVDRKRIGIPRGDTRDIHIDHPD